MDYSLCTKILDNISRVIVGKKHPQKLLLTALLAEGHALLEDVPGVGKTLMAKSLAVSIGGSCMRVQFTPDLLPADITGFSVYNQKSGDFIFQPGPVFTNILLADEINRTIPRTQSSLLEAMEERQVTVDGATRPLPRPFLVIATQNPIELEGTYPLPEAQLDRFLLRVTLGYPTREEESEIMARFQESDPLAEIRPVTGPEEIVTLQKARREIKISPAVRDYIVQLVDATRNSPYLRFGASPRASLNLMQAAQGFAALEKRNYVLPDDIKELAVPVLAHRLILQAAEKMRGRTARDVLEEILSTIPVPAPVEIE